MNDQPATQKHRRHWLRPRLTILLVLLLVGVVFGVLEWMEGEEKRQHEILVELEQMRASDHGYDKVVHYSGDERSMPLFSRVRGLFLYFAPVSDISWASEMENLKVLKLYETNVVDEQVNRLQQALPDCKIIR